jgi:hypothetical protein
MVELDSARMLGEWHARTLVPEVTLELGTLLRAQDRLTLTTVEAWLERHAGRGLVLGYRAAFGLLAERLPPEK